MTQNFKTHVPPAPTPKWNRDGSPDFSQFDQPDATVDAIRAKRQAEQTKKLQAAYPKGVPQMPQMERNADGTPDFRHLLK